MNGATSYIHGVKNALQIRRYYDVDSTMVCGGRWHGGCLHMQLYGLYRCSAVKECNVLQKQRILA